MAPLLLVLLLAETGPPPDPYEPLIFQMMLHEVVVRALEPVVPRIPQLAVPWAVTVPVSPTPAAAGVPAPVLVKAPVTGTAGVPGAVTTRVGVAPAGVPAVAEVKAPVTGTAGVPGTVATRVGIAPAGVPGAVAVQSPVTGAAGVPGAVEVKSPAVAGLAVGPAAVNAAPTPSPTVAADSTVTVLLARLRAGDRGSEVRRGLQRLGLPALVDILAREPLTSQSVVADEVAGIAISCGLDPLSEEAAPAVRLQIARHLARTADPRVPVVCEGILAHSALSENLLWAATDTLAKHLRRHERTDDVVQAWEHLQTRFRDPRMAALARYEVAVALDAAGRESEATVALRSVAGFGYGWATGLALMRLANRLEAAGKYDEAQAVLAQPVTGLYADQISLGLSYERARMSLFQGDAEAAAAELRRGLERAAAVARPLRGENIDAVTDFCRRLLAWAEGWVRAPLQSPQTALTVTVAPTAPTEIDCRVRGLLAQPIEARCSLPVVEVLAEDLGWLETNEFGEKRRQWERRVRLRLRPGTPPGDYRGELAVASGSAQLTLPVAITVLGRARLAPSPVLLGSLPRGGSKSVEVTVTADSIQSILVRGTTPWLAAAVERLGALRLTARREEASQLTGYVQGELTVVITYQDGLQESYSLLCAGLWR